MAIEAVCERLPVHWWKLGQVLLPTKVMRGKHALMECLKEPEFFSDSAKLVLDRSQTGCVAGIETRKTEPAPGVLSTAIIPPCSSVIHRAIAKPSPAPPVFFERTRSAR